MLKDLGCTEQSPRNRTTKPLNLKSSEVRIEALILDKIDIYRKHSVFLILTQSLIA